MTAETAAPPIPTALARAFARQHAASRATLPSSAGARRAQLAALAAALDRHRDALCAALDADFGHRPAAETLLLEIGPTQAHIAHLRRHLRGWMRPRRRAPDPLLATNAAWVDYRPKGVVGIIVPWNYPVYLALGPLATALAAGNRVLIAMSEFSPATARALDALIAETFPPDQAQVLDGGIETARALATLPLDHLIFTGSTRVGRLVMAAAAENLVPVTLELGGKSPAIVATSADPVRAAQRIAHGKLANAGQTCVAPDYALIPRGSEPVFIAALRAAVERLEADDPAAGRGWVISARHRARLAGLIDDAMAKGARLTVLGRPETGRLMPLHVLTGVTDAMAVMHEEIFGPILPLLPHDGLDDAIAFVGARPRPLALYLFSDDRAEQKRVLAGTCSGGVTLNSWGAHVITHSLPFGGIGPSGMGSTHGEEGFRALSHARGVLRLHRWFPIELSHPPYTGRLGRLLLAWSARRR